MAAFEKAKGFGCEMFELDVHMSKDGELVVHHDDQLIRCTNIQHRFPGRSSYFVSDFTWDELQTLDAGSWFVEQLSLPADRRQTLLQSLTSGEMDAFISPREREHFASGAVKIPSLRQALELAARTGMLVNIELKSLPRMYPGMTAVATKLVKSMGLEHRVLISSFDHEQLVVVRQSSSIVATAVLTSDRIAELAKYLKLLDADAYHPGCYGDNDSLGFGSVSGKLDPRNIVEARAVGRGVHVWTCNDKDQMRQLIAAGVTGLISDFPNRVRDVLHEPR